MSLMQTQANAHTFGLTIRRDAAFARLGGDIGLRAAPDLTRLMDSLDLLAYLAVDVDMSDVTFLDGYGVRPLVEATRRRRRDQLPPVRIGKCSPSARLFLQVSGLEGRPHLDLSAWDRIAVSAAGKPGVASSAEGHAETVRVPFTPHGIGQGPHTAPLLDRERH